MNATTRRALRGLLCLAAAPMLMGSECEPPLVKDSGFDVWCGDALCDWQVDAGSIAKVPTWHERDYGVGLIGDPATISQSLPFTSDDVGCIHFDLLAKVDETANVVLTMDFVGGDFTSSETIPSGVWTPLSYHLVTPSYFQSLHISIRKVGGGQAALARIQASKASDCAGPRPVGALARPVGAACETASQCAGALCRARTAAGTLFGDDAGRQVCAACGSDADCSAGQVCGLAWDPAFIEPFPACVLATAAALGDRCLVDGECASGTSCCQGVCSTCCATSGASACAPGTACAPRAKAADGKPVRTAWQCTPDDGRGAPDSLCLANDDCASGACAGGGVLRVCADGRRCASDTDCPTGAPGNPCTAIGVAGGKCQ